MSPNSLPQFETLEGTLPFPVAPATYYYRSTVLTYLTSHRRHRSIDALLLVDYYRHDRELHQYYDAAATS